MTSCLWALLDQAGKQGKNPFCSLFVFPHLEMLGLEKKSVDHHYNIKCGLSLSPQFLFQIPVTTESCMREAVFRKVRPLLLMSLLEKLDSPLHDEAAPLCTLLQHTGKCVHLRLNTPQHWGRHPITPSLKPACWFESLTYVLVKVNGMKVGIFCLIILQAASFRAVTISRCCSKEWNTRSSHSENKGRTSQMPLLTEKIWCL